MTPQQMQAALLATIVVLLLVIIGGTLHHRAWMAKHCVCGHQKPGLRSPPREGFGDSDNWPGSGTFGAMADTFPYGTYADGKSTFYPTYDEYNPYWTRA